MLSIRRPARIAMVLAIAALPLLLPVISARASSGSAQTTTSSTTSSGSHTTTSTTTSTSSVTTESTSSSTTSQTTTTATATATQSTTAPQGDKPVTLHTNAGPTAHAAGDPSDTIVDFNFSPATVTIHVGDTVTWTNQGKQPHTATANDGSFDTGTLKTGQSASHQFTKAGTFAYICSIHPFMHGTVIVQGASGGSGNTGSGGSGASGGSGGSGSGGSGSSNGSGNTGSGASSGTTGTTGTTLSQTASTGLPNTGMNLRDLLIAAFVLVGAGILLRRQLSS